MAWGLSKYSLLYDMHAWFDEWATHLFLASLRHKLKNVHQVKTSVLLHCLLLKIEANSQDGWAD